MPERRHIYLSSYCVHGDHRECRLVCKTCSAPCICSCHDWDTAFTDDAHRRRIRGRALLAPPFEPPELELPGVAP